MIAAAPTPIRAREAISSVELLGDGRQQRADAEDRQPDDQRPLAAEAVAEAAGDQQQAGEDEQVAVHDPLQLARAGVELLADRRQRDVEDRVVDARRSAGSVASTTSACQRRAYRLDAGDMRLLLGVHGISTSLTATAVERSATKNGSSASASALGRGLDRPPDRVAARGARGQRRRGAGAGSRGPGRRRTRCRTRAAAWRWWTRKRGMRRAFPAHPSPRHRGATLIRDPEFVGPGLCSPVGLDMATVAEQLVGRAAELGALERAVERLGARAGRRRSLLVGEPGIGKTRLLAELAARADARGCIVLAGQRLRARGGPAVLGLRRRARRVRRRASTRAGSRRSTTTCAPSSACVLPVAVGVRRRAPRRRARTSATAPTARCASCSSGSPRRSRSCCVLDDVHWADSASIELLGALLRRPPAAAVLLALGGAAAADAGAARAARSSARHRAGALTRHRARRARARRGRRSCSATRSSGALADVLYDESGGNPFYLEQLARSPRARRRRAAGRRRPGAGRRRGAARRSPRALTEELALLRGAARRLLEGAAVAGDPFEPELAAAAAAVDEPAAVEALDELLARGPRPARPTCRGASASATRSSAARSTTAAPGGWVLGAHERCADGAGRARRVRGGARAPRRARGAPGRRRRGRAAARGRRRAATLARAGERRALVRRGAARCSRTSAPPEERVGLLHGRAPARWPRSGSWRDSRADLLEALALLPGATAVATRVQLTVACAGVEHLLGRPRPGARAASPTRSSACPIPRAREAVALMIELAIDEPVPRATSTRCATWARAGARRRAAARRPAADRDRGGRGRRWRGACSGRDRRGRGSCAPRPPSSSTRCPTPSSPRGSDAAGYLATAELYLDRFAEAAAHAERGLEVARATGQHGRRRSIPTLGTARSMRGRLAEAGRGARRRRSRRRGSAASRRRSRWTLVNRSLVGARRRRRRDGARVRRGGRRADAAARRALHLGLGRRWRSPPRCSPAGEPAAGRRGALSAAGGEELAAIPGGLARAGSRAAHALPAGARPSATRRERAPRAPRRSPPSVGLPMAAGLGRARRGGGRARRAATPARRPSAALASAAAPSGAGARGRGRACRARSPGGRSRWPATASARWPSSSARRRRSTPAGAAPAATPPSASCASSAAASTGARARAAPTATALDSLTERELQVARLVVDRRTNPRDRRPSCS